MITSPRLSDTPRLVAVGLGSALHDAGTPCEIALVDSVDRSAPEPPSEADPLAKRLRVGDASAARAVILETPGILVIAAAGILESGMPVTLAAACDAVVLAVRQGNTIKADLEPAARAIRDAGGNLVLAAYGA